VNLSILTQAHVRRVLIEHGVAVGIELNRIEGGGKRGPIEQVKCKREVIVCAGAVNSPQLLMLSGVGPAQELRALGIQVHADRQGVGQNLQDHLICPQPFETFEKHGLSAREEKTIGNALKFFTLGKGAFATCGTEVTAFVKTDPARATPDLQLIGLAVLPVDELYQNANVDPSPVKDLHIGFCFLPCLLHPKSKGHIKLYSKDPFHAPLITPNYLTHEDDVRVLMEGIRMSRKAALETKALGPKVKSYIRYPGESCEPFNSEKELRDFVCKRSYTLYHPIGTCAMGPAENPLSVVDPSLRVIGVKGLRVADASIMPDMPSGNTNIPSVMIGEKAADLIKNSHTAKL